MNVNFSSRTETVEIPNVSISNYIAQNLSNVPIEEKKENFNFASIIDNFIYDLKISSLLSEEELSEVMLWHDNFTNHYLYDLDNLEIKEIAAQALCYLSEDIIAKSYHLWPQDKKNLFHAFETDIINMLSIILPSNVDAIDFLDAYKEYSNIDGKLESLIQHVDDFINSNRNELYLREEQIQNQILDYYNTEKDKLLRLIQEKKAAGNAAVEDINLYNAQIEKYMVLINKKESEIQAASTRIQRNFISHNESLIRCEKVIKKGS
ncbi:MAG: hypothetical protein H0U27_14790 [Nitrosopumilus sp.]|nr:hypothetical protein [Nitrosopumilus sp.]